MSSFSSEFYTHGCGCGNDCETYKQGEGEKKISCGGRGSFVSKIAKLFETEKAPWNP